MQGDTLQDIRHRFYASFQEANIADWEREFIALNPFWNITPGSTFQREVLLHMPNIDPTGKRKPLSGGT